MVVITLDIKFRVQSFEPIKKSLKKKSPLLNFFFKTSLNQWERHYIMFIMFFESI